MSSHRGHTQILEDFDSSSSSLGVFGGGRSSGTSLNIDCERQTKRRKVSGANSRFDRMVETMSMTRRSPVKANRRHRARSVGSSSISNHDVPQNPNEAYEGRRAGPLGKDFALIKMNAGHTSGSDGPLRGASKIVSDHPDPKPLPPWLSNTLTSLDTKHPLRLLLPKSHQPPPPPGLVDRSENIIVEDEPVFAFLQADLSPDALTYDGLAINYVGLEKDIMHPPNASKTLPFSTPGQGSLTSKLRPPLSPATYVSNHGQNTTTIISRHDSPPDDGMQNLDFIPFATPGPGPLVSIGNSPSNSSRILAITEDHRIVIDPDTAHFLDHLPFSTPGPTSLATASSLPPPADLRLPSYVASMSDAAPRYSSDDMPDYNIYCDDLSADSDPPHDPLAYTQPLPNLFATPGPGYRPQQIYFDSPTEDPSDSDSLQPGCDIDYDSLDFHWYPFNRKGTNVTRNEETVSSILLQHEDLEADLDASPNSQEIFQATKQDKSHQLKRVPSPTPFAFSVDSQCEAYTPYQHLLQQRQTTPESQEHIPGVFAPAPGIFLSPLRVSVLSNSLDGSPSGPVTPGQKLNLLGALDRLYAPSKELSVKRRPSTRLNSQESNDSIESWQEADIWE